MNSEARRKIEERLDEIDGDILALEAERSELEIDLEDLDSEEDGEKNSKVREE